MTQTGSQTGAPEFLHLPDDGGVRLAYRQIAGKRGVEKAGVVWLGGFKSDMLSTKAERIAQWASANGRAFLRFDYSGHGESEGRFEDGTIGGWSRQSEAMIRKLTQGPQILVGSSMGGWIALLVARSFAQLGESHRLAGLALIAPAVDFTQELMWPQLPDAAKRDVLEKGFWLRPTQYADEPYPVTRKLFEDGRENLLFNAPVRSHCPVHILQGMEDPDVPWRHAQKLAEHLAQDPVTLTFIRDGDHRLSREEDIERLLRAIEGLS